MGRAWARLACVERGEEGQGAGTGNLQAWEVQAKAWREQRMQDAIAQVPAYLIMRRERGWPEQQPAALRSIISGKPHGTQSKVRHRWVGSQGTPASRYLYRIRGGGAEGGIYGGGGRRSAV